MICNLSKRYVLQRLLLWARRNMLRRWLVRSGGELLVFTREALHVCMRNGKASCWPTNLG